MSIYREQLLGAAFVIALLVGCGGGRTNTILHATSEASDEVAKFQEMMGESELLSTLIHDVRAVVTHEGCLYLEITLEDQWMLRDYSTRKDDAEALQELWGAAYHGERNRLVRVMLKDKDGNQIGDTTESWNVRVDRKLPGGPGTAQHRATSEILSDHTEEQVIAAFFDQISDSEVLKFVRDEISESLKEYSNELVEASMNYFGSSAERIEDENGRARWKVNGKVTAKNNFSGLKNTIRWNAIVEVRISELSPDRTQAHFEYRLKDIETDRPN